ncbi:hypothetical protein, partial [Escherichia coli]
IVCNVYRNCERKKIVMNIVPLSVEPGGASEPSETTELLSIDERIRKNQVSESNETDESSSPEQIYQLINFRWFSEEISKTPDNDDNQW